MKEQANYYDVVYKTKSGRLMVAKRIEASTAKVAKSKLKKQMRKSTSFKSIVTTVKI